MDDKKQQIPRIIHYCWFGHNEKPEIVLRCMESWKKYCPNYEFREWNEENFDVSVCKYAADAYANKKWAFVSDYVRIKVLLTYGGIYIDTDVELLKPIDDLLNREAFMGFELGLDGSYGVNTGSMMGSVPGSRYLRLQEAAYRNYSFYDGNGGLNLRTCVEYTTQILSENGLETNNEYQTVLDTAIFPSDYFSPMNMTTGKLSITENTYSIHRYAGSWAPESVRYGYRLKWECIEKYGAGIGKLIYLIRYSLYILSHEGFTYYVEKLIGKLKRNRRRK